jgi:3-(3-hydroxy-phenyl)propionate hydroxylase
VIAPDRVPVVVVGAGPTGVTAATLLAQYGIDSLLLDRWHSVYPQPRAVHLDDEVFRILARLGIAEQFSAISRPALGLRLLDSRMRTLAEFRRDTSLSCNGFPQANMFDQPHLETLLRANLAHHPRARLRGDVEVTGITTGPSGVTRVAYADRADGAEHVVEADYVLGCDGANSIVRSHIGATMVDLKFEQRWLVVDIATDADLHQWEGVHQICDAHRAGTYMRIGGRRYRWEFRLLDGETAADFGTVDALLPLIRPWVAQVPPGALELVRVTEYTFRAQLADSWRRDNVFLLGDAAHLTPPFVGQGMGAGLRDAMNLSWKLAGVLTGALSDSVLDTYQQERKPHAHAMITIALSVGRAMTAGGDFGSLLRRLVLPRLHLLPGISGRVLDGGSPALHRTALIQKSYRPGQLAGTLCPNPMLADGRRLDDVLGTGFAVLCLTAPTAHERALVEARGATVHPVEPGTELADWLQGGHTTAAVIRPDRTVLRCGRQVADLCAALPGPPLFRHEARQ